MSLLAGLAKPGTLDDYRLDGNQLSYSETYDEAGQVWTITNVQRNDSDDSEELASLHQAIADLGFSRSLPQPVSLTNIKRARENTATFVAKKSNGSHEPESKGGWEERRVADDYNKILPRFQGLSFNDRIKALPP